MRMYKMVMLIVMAMSLMSFSVLAGSGHSHAPVDKEKASILATRIVSSLANRDVIEKSWQTVEITEIEVKAFKGGKEWVATFNNPSISDPEKRTLYVFLTLSGEYLAANYTGM
ncbi:MAG: hypothetical protein KZQ94_10600 [Candidatus Thiodiazotropha sp. (ex Troendleina suluensis)]|nr:hypothetical protein [Candidatus Thiodiazotropha sp. (ex Troendleina suluensis)]MCU7945996.1 hypothetical protein [Candidatus Thiodiazotropha sp. (ex Cardiolucina cf. quadrata)]